mmetsp:Transcript_268/g.719  ORF Transcript_268/g.719 Transcript_268/m.719 type:complete len:228 (+) Transcript_268:569-1252(+)
MECPCTARIRVTPADSISSNRFLSLARTTFATSCSVQPISCNHLTDKTSCKSQYPSAEIVTPRSTALCRKICVKVFEMRTSRGIPSHHPDLAWPFPLRPPFPPPEDELPACCGGCGNAAEAAEPPVAGDRRDTSTASSLSAASAREPLPPRARGGGWPGVWSRSPRAERAGVGSVAGRWRQLSSMSPRDCCEAVGCFAHRRAPEAPLMAWALRARRRCRSHANGAEL